MSSRVINPASAALHVFALSGFSVAQPIYDLLSRQAEFFVARNSGVTDIIILVVALSIALPAGITGLLLLCRRFAPALYPPACAISIGLLGALLLLIVLKQQEILQGYTALASTLMFSALLAAAYLESGAIATTADPAVTGWTTISYAVCAFP